MPKRLFKRRSVTLGLDIRPGELRYACLKNTAHGPTLIHHGQTEAKPTDEGFLLAAEAVKSSLERRKVRPSRIIAGLPRQWCFIKRLTLPAMAEEDVGRALAFELEKHLPIEPASLLYDHAVVPGSAGPEMTALVGAVRRGLAESFLSALRSQELEPEALVPAPFANMELLKLCRPGVAEKPTVLVVEQDDLAVGVDLFEGGRLRSCQTFSREGLSEAEAAADLEKVLYKWLSPVRRQFESQAGFSWLYLGPPGGEAAVALKNLGLASPESVDQRRAMRVSEEVDLARYHTAAGLAFLDHRDEPMPINLMPAAPAAAAPRRLPTRTVLLGAALVLVAGLYATNIVRDRWELGRLQESVDALRPKVEEVHRLQRELNQLKARAEAIESIADRNPSALDILKELTLVIPPSAWLTEVNFDGRELLIGGYAQSAQELIGLLEESPLFANSEFRGTITKRQDKERFKIAAQVER